jgi:3-methyladenine DNA glycosylase AlkD
MSVIGAGTVEEVLALLAARGSTEAVAGMARYGINTSRAVGVSVLELRRIAKSIGRDHELALGLWASGIHECQLLAGMVADPALATEDLLEEWVLGLDSWDLCDQTCGNLFAQVPGALDRAPRWSRRPEEFVKRAGFALMAELAWFGKGIPDAAFEPFFDAIVRESGDQRNFVKKAVNWALRNIGKRNPRLHSRAVEVAATLKASGNRTARWIGSDALRELTSAKVLGKLGLAAGESRESS